MKIKVSEIISMRDDLWRLEANIRDARWDRDDDSEESRRIVKRLQRIVEGMLEIEVDA